MRTKEKNGILLLSTVVVLVILVALVILGNIIVVGDKISNVSPFLSWVFYVIIGGLFIWAIVWPIIRVVITPPLSGFRIEDLKDLSPVETTAFIRDLRKRVCLTREEDKELHTCDDRKLAIEKILKSRFEEMEQVVKTSAVSNFTITAVSQSGTFDFITSMSINLKMINEVIRKLGVRPSYTQLVKLYVSVLSASLIITTLDDMLDDIDFGELVGGLGVLGGQVANIVVPSATNGMMNALVTLRVGYTTIKYLEVGNRSFDKSEARRWAVKSARKQIVGVGKEGVSQIYRRVKNGVSELMVKE